MMNYWKSLEGEIEFWRFRGLRMKWAIGKIRKMVELVKTRNKMLKLEIGNGKSNQI